MRYLSIWQRRVPTSGATSLNLLTHSLIQHFESVLISKKLQTTTEMWLSKDFKIQIAKKTLWKKINCSFHRLSLNMPRLNQNQRFQALTMLARDDNVSNVSRAFGCHRNTIMRLRKRFQQTGGVAYRRRPGRRRVTNPRTDRFITLTHLRRRFQTATSSARQYGISKQTVLRRLRQARQPIRPRRPYARQGLTARHRAARCARQPQCSRLH